MSYLRSIPPGAGLLEIFQAFPEAARPLLEYHEVLLRGDSPLSSAERELIAAYVSGLNNCNYCRAVHSQAAISSESIQKQLRKFSPAPSLNMSPYVCSRF